MKNPSVNVKSVLVTGCPSGIGFACAAVLRDAGWCVFPTARKQEDLDHLQANGFTPVRLKVADSDSVQQAIEQTLELSKGQLGGVVNNAGFGQPGALEDLSREAMQYQFEVNVIGMQQLTNMLIPVFKKQGWGRDCEHQFCSGARIVFFYGHLFSV
ncbi:MAG: SDR family NAD(P)-dependent oxidoreductase [Kiritimatiellae bacterium]|nr:SDR family NAD(P)-dependent oxidoreductase [Kiritimatiellia bacterium]